MKPPAMEPAHSPFGCPSALALLLALTKPYMTRYNHKTPADRYKKAQPLMVPFDAEEESTSDKLLTQNPNP